MQNSKQQIKARRGRTQASLFHLGSRSPKEFFPVVAFGAHSEQQRPEPGGVWDPVCSSAGESEGLGTTLPPALQASCSLPSHSRISPPSVLLSHLQPRSRAELHPPLM